MTASDLIGAVMEKARLETREETTEIVAAVTGAMASHFEAEAWEAIKPAIPAELVGEGEAVTGEEAHSVQHFFLAIGDRLEVSSAEAAVYARVVAESIRQELSPDQVQELAAVLNDDLLALFESGDRGELTGPPGPTEGAQRGTPPDEAEERLRQP